MAKREIIEAKRLLSIADHMAYITYPVLKENRLLIKILEQISSALDKTMKAILENEYYQKRIQKFDDPKLNFDAFLGSATYYGLEPIHIKTIKQIAGIMEMHKKSPMEFVRKDTFIIMSDNLQTEQISLERVKIFLKISQQILENTEMKLIKDRGLQ